MVKVEWDCAQVKEPTKKVLNSPDLVRLECRDMATMAQESIQVLTLDTRNKLIDRHMVTLGLVASSLVHPREVFRPAIADGASSVVLVHNHPSGDPTPSAEDLKVTRQLVAAGKIIGIEVLDHIVIGRGETPFISLREKGLANFNP